MGSSYIVRKGGKTVNQAATPSINFVSKTNNSITVTFKNNDEESATITYRLDSLEAEGESVFLAADATSSNITFAGLDVGTEYTVFAIANVIGKVKSDPASTNITTDAPVYTEATGGTTLEYNDSGKWYRSHTFTSNGTFTVTTVGDNIDDRNKVDYLIIAGGGSGGRDQGTGAGGGGGGAGGYRTTNGTSGADTAARTKKTVTAQTYGIVIGAGGSGTSIPGNNGTASTALGESTVGGGRGGAYNGSSYLAPQSGGSGGGGAGFQSTTGAAGTADEGRAGGNGITGVPYNAGGGGGALNVGGNAVTNDGGAGGDGIANLLRTGSNETRAGGGGGGAGQANRNGGVGGAGGGGAGRTVGVSGTPESGTVNTGSGGGGNTQEGGNTVDAGNGGAGIVVIRYEIAPQ
jgi:hypothetical protein